MFKIETCFSNASLKFKTCLSVVNVLLNNLGSVVENWIFWRGIQFSITNNMPRLLDSFFKVKLHLLSLLLVFICISRSKPKRKKKNVVLLLTHKGFSILPLLVFHLSFFSLHKWKMKFSHILQYWITSSLM